MQKKYIVRLTDEKRLENQEVVNKLKGSSPANAQLLEISEVNLVGGIPDRSEGWTIPD
jgi:hypothetical protein